MVTNKTNTRDKVLAALAGSVVTYIAITRSAVIRDKVRDKMKNIELKEEGVKMIEKSIER